MTVESARTAGSVRSRVARTAWRAAVFVHRLSVAATLVGIGASSMASADEADRVDRGSIVQGAATATARATATASASAFVREVAPGHFVHVGRHEDMAPGNDGDIATIGFVVGDDAVAVIDPGAGSAVAGALERAIRAHTSLPVTHVVLTHFHPDHVLGGHVFAGADVVVVAHADHVRAAVQRGAFYLDRYAALVAPAEPLLVPTLELESGDTIDIRLGGRTLAVTAWPTAHTDNDVSVFDADGGVLWTGDLVVATRTPSLDGSLVGWLGVLDALAALDARIVVPGHGEPDVADAIIAPERRYLASLLDTTRARIAAGDSLSDALSDAETASPGRWQLFELHHPANVTRAWTELEWE